MVDQITLLKWTYLQGEIRVWGKLIRLSLCAEMNHLLDKYYVAWWIQLSSRTV